MKRFITPLLILVLVISGIFLLNGKPASYPVFPGSPAKIDSVRIDPSLGSAKCERSKIWSSLHRHTENSDGSSSTFNFSNLSMTFEKEVGISSGYYWLKTNLFSGGRINLTLTHALEPKVMSSDDAPKKTGYLKIIRIDSLGKDSV